MATIRPDNLIELVKTAKASDASHLYWLQEIMEADINQHPINAIIKHEYNTFRLIYRLLHTNSSEDMIEDMWIASIR